MLSDDSSSDTETGRFKGRSENKDEQAKSPRRNDGFRSRGSIRPFESERYNRDMDRKRNERDHFERHPRDRPRHSPSNRRRHSRDRSPYSRRSRDRHRHSRDVPKSKHRSSSRDRVRHSQSRSCKSSEPRKIKVETKKISHDDKSSVRLNKNLRDPSFSPDRKSKQPTVHKAIIETKKVISLQSKGSDKLNKKSEQPSSSPDRKTKRSIVHKPITMTTKSNTPEPIELAEDKKLIEVQEGSYYSMIPAVVKEVSEESSEIDSSDDERLRAKLLNLEKELHKSHKKKHKKRNKKKSSKSDKNDDIEITSVEVSSTTDVQNKGKAESPSTHTDMAEVTSTQKNKEKESSEEGEISSDDNSQDLVDIDPNDLRHKLSRRIDQSQSPDLRKKLKVRTEVCGPALPPHLERSCRKSTSPSTEGPALPPYLRKGSRNIGPSIPADMREVLAESSREVIKYESSDEDGIGPLPVGSEGKWSDAHQLLEVRALDMKIRKLDGHSMQNSDVKSREQWMLELPEAKAKILGLEARSFRAKEGPDMTDRSSWTDTPEEKARKAAGLQKEEDADMTLQREARAHAIANRDEDQEKAAKKHKKKHKREESLLDIHQKKLKKKKKKEDKEEGGKERRPFSRDVDLQVNRFDEAQKKSIIKKAQNLNTRFSRGEAKYL